MVTTRRVARHRTRGGAADNLRLSVFNVVNHIVARHGVKADDGRGGYRRHTFAGAARVTRLIADRGGQGVSRYWQVRLGHWQAALSSNCRLPAPWSGS
ncbi:Uncharacterised protein [Escherichia coli]|uniref:Uncharacterized protein n=1 Tax=Escherichia coli TaxID=562 RepID=A0A376LJH5_ECOLX|nr:Uncharacterised protein [Escherichia coli]